MKRAVLAIAIAAALCQGALAQGSDESSENSVLEKARQKYAESQRRDERDERSSREEREEREDRDESLEEIAGEIVGDIAEEIAAAIEKRGEEREVPFTPFLVSFVPGLSVPFGTWDAAFSAGPIGVMTRDVFGFQGAGVFSMARDVAGFQGAGVFSLAEGEVSGFQGSGVFNIAGGEVSGAQFAGVFNIADGGLSGFQGAGVFNIAGDAEAPIQAAGVFNIAEDIDGFQLAGLFNIANRISGGQAASIVNVAEEVDGIQLGLVNIADRVNGIQLGLVNIARDAGVNSEGGFYEPQTEYGYLAFQAGTRPLYGVFALGQPKGQWIGAEHDGLVLSYGLGTRLRLSGAYLDLDVSAASFVGPELPAIGAAIESGQPLADASSLVPYPSLRLCLGVPLLGKLHLVGGLKADIDLDAAPRVPEALKRGESWSSEFRGVGFTAWTKWYLGIKI